VLESMKMEISLESPCAGVVRELRAQPGSTVRAGQCLVVIEAG
jgi:urea carboxylase